MDKDRLYGSCHCGAVRFSIPRSLDTSAVRRCDCSLCKRRGAVMLACPIEDVKIENGDEHLVHYKWNTKVATHHFCSKCGIMTHHQRRTTPQICGINIGCIDEFNYRSFQDVPMNNGVDLALVEKQPTSSLFCQPKPQFCISLCFSSMLSLAALKVSKYLCSVPFIPTFAVAPTAVQQHL